MVFFAKSSIRVVPMTSGATRVVPVLLLLLIGFAAACGKTPTTPGSETTNHSAAMGAASFTLRGRVSEANASLLPVVGASVEVVTGAGANISAETDGFGWYRLDGVAGETYLRVSKPGYASAEQALYITDHRWVHVALRLLQPHEDISGTYTLTIKAADNCGVGLGAGQLPRDAHVRHYQAVIRHVEQGLDVRVTGDAVLYGYFPGRMEPGRVWFNLAWYNDGGDPDPSIVEQLPTSGFLTAGGVATTNRTENGLHGSLRGDLRVFATESSSGLLRDLIARCTSDDHQFTLSR